MKVSRAEFQAKLNLLRPGLADKEIISQSASFAFHTNRIYTYNDMVAVSVPFESDLEGAVPGESLIQLLDKMTQESITVNMTDDQFTVQAQNVSAGLRIEKEISLPVDELEIPTEWKKLPADFTTALRFCMFSTSSDTSKPVLTCIHIENNYVESCDNYRATRYFVPEKGMANLLIPSSSANALLKYKPQKYGVTEGWVHFEAEGVVFSCRTYAEEYPDVGRLFAVKGKKLSLPEGIGTALERASIFTSMRKAVDETATLSMGDGVLVIIGMGDGGWYKEKLKVDYHEEPIKFCVNPHFLKEAIPLTREITLGTGALVLAGDCFKHVVSLSVTE
jgi:DNA polymerase III sliding clamp (beta) subunit (PCNA family)